MSNFWKELKQKNKPISVLAPMYDVTDTVFRELISEISKPDVMFTEFFNCDAFCSQGKKKIIHKTWFSEKQRPIVAQIWGVKPETHYETAKELVKMGFDGIDMNMGCPQRGEIKVGACAALIDNHELASELILATQKGIKAGLEECGKSNSSDITDWEMNGMFPLSVKTRIGTKTPVTSEWISFLLNFNFAAITLHARTVKDMSIVPAQWEHVSKMVELRDKLNPQTITIGNGDVIDYVDGMEHCKNFGCDGYMIGRGIFTNPWAFTTQLETVDQRKQKLLNVALRHLELWEQTYPAYEKSKRNYNVLKKFFKIYINGYEDASQMRERIMKTTSVPEARTLIDFFLD